MGRSFGARINFVRMNPGGVPDKTRAGYNFVRIKREDFGPFVLVYGLNILSSQPGRNTVVGKRRHCVVGNR